MNWFDLSEASVEDLHHAIGDFIMQAVGDDWQTATIVAVIEADDNGRTSGRSTTGPDGTQATFEADHRMYLAFDELRRRMRTPDEQPWTKATFSLERSGKFDLEFEYPDQRTLTSRHTLPSR
jgi:hypothetical protein